jgi:hypothetical protein
MATLTGPHIICNRTGALSQCQEKSLSKYDNPPPYDRSESLDENVFLSMLRTLLPSDATSGASAHWNAPEKAG